MSKKRRRLKYFLASSLLILPLATFMADMGFSKSQPQKARTIDELIKMYDSSECIKCHVKEYEEWKDSLHARSLIGTMRTLGSLRTTILNGFMKEQKLSGVKSVEDIQVKHLMQCFKCHLPQIEDATDEVAKQIAKAIIDLDEATLSKLNINCLICHNKKAIIHKWIDGEPEKNVVYGTKDGAHPYDKYPVHKKSPVMKEAVFCGQCHGLGPNFEQPNPTQCATLYGSYLHAYIPSGGTKTCQECHMHDFKKGHHMSSYRDPDVGKRAVEVVIEAPSYFFLPKAGDFVPTIPLTIKLTNKAGHRIPDG